MVSSEGAYLAEVDYSLVDAQPQRQQGNAQAELLLAALALPRPHSLQLNLQMPPNNPSAKEAFCTLHGIPMHDLEQHTLIKLPL